LLPFGEVDQKFTSNFNERVADLHLLGFKEVLEHPDEIAIDENLVKVPTLPGMIILKLVAWSDRPEDRGNDLYDILRIIENYFHYNYNEIVEEHYDTFPEDGFDQLKISSRVLGRKAGQYMMNSKELTDRIRHTLDKNTLNPQSSMIAKNWAQDKGWELDYAHSLVEELKLGFFEI
jgi:predicted nucleotidyltransferase